MGKSYGGGTGMGWGRLVLDSFCKVSHGRGVGKSCMGEGWGESLVWGMFGRDSKRVALERDGKERLRIETQHVNRL